MSEKENDNINNLPPEFSEDELKMPDGMKPIVEEKHHGKLALILVGLIVALVCILGGLYLWYLNIMQPQATEPLRQPAQEQRVVPEMPNEPEMENANAAKQQLETVSTSNEIDAIEADLESTDLDAIDAELNAIDAELEAALE